MISASLVHNFLISQLETSLFRSLMEHDPTRVAYQRPGVELGMGGHHCPEPDAERRRMPWSLSRFQEGSPTM